MGRETEALVLASIKSWAFFQARSLMSFGLCFFNLEKGYIFRLQNIVNRGHGRVRAKPLGQFLAYGSCLKIVISILRVME